MGGIVTDARSLWAGARHARGRARIDDFVESVILRRLLSQTWQKHSDQKLPAATFLPTSPGCAGGRRHPTRLDAIAEGV
jgi:hypothetical protein